MEKNIDKNKNPWKIVAIVLLIIVIFESSYIFMANNTVKDYNYNNVMCSNDKCVPLNASSYLYDSNTRTCSCYDSTDREIYREILD